MKLNIAIIIGTSRIGRKSELVAKLIENECMKFDGLTTVMVDPRDLDLPFDGNDEEYKDQRYSKITENADGFIIVTPEYNHSFPGSLKRLLDSELNNYIHKPVAYAGVSAGPWGGVRAIENLINSTRELGLVSTFTDTYFPFVNDLFNENGSLLNMEYVERIENMINELIWMSKSLKWGRKNLESKFHGK